MLEKTRSNCFLLKVLVREIFQKKKICQYCGKSFDYKKYKKDLRAGYPILKVFDIIIHDIPKCELCFKCSLPNYMDDYPNFHNKSMNDLYGQLINVDEIIGGNSTRSFEYWADWTMKRKDGRMRTLEEKIIIDGNIDLKRLRNIVSDPSTNISERIHLVCILQKSESKKYYVSSDGHRRVSLAKKYNIKQIFADITEIYYDLI